MFVFLMLSFHLWLPYPVRTNLTTCISNRYEAAPYGGGYGPVNELLLFSGFPPCAKINISKFQFKEDRGPR